jgi:mRNA interferase MazF
MTESSLNFGDIVLLKFPFTDGNAFKRRPALVINDYKDGDIIVCRITCQMYKTKHDVLILDWKKAGLKLPSIIRVHKIATLDKGMVEVNIGNIDESTGNKVKKVIKRLTD